MIYIFEIHVIFTVTLPAHGSKSNQGRFFPCEGSVMVGALTLFLDILGGWLLWPQGGLRGVGEEIFWPLYPKMGQKSCFLTKISIFGVKLPKNKSYPTYKLIFHG